MFINTYYLHWEDWPTALSFPPLPPNSPPSLTPPTTRGPYIYDRQAEHRHTIFNDDTLPGKNRPPLPMKSKFTPKDTELNLVTAQTEESANGNYLWSILK